jgi:hypothetical protein
MENCTAEVDGLAAGFDHERRGGVPVGYAALGEQAHAGRCGVDHSDVAFGEPRDEVAEGGVVEFVAAEREDRFDHAGRGAGDHFGEDLQR